ncbi:MAG: thioesterase [Acidimicrobiia bacterium]|nr:thioesterase [Acidimicrobiia bacterium]
MIWSPARSYPQTPGDQASGVSSTGVDEEHHLQAGLSAEITLTVAESDTAIALGSGDVPVLATPRLVALCEEATVAAMAGQIPEGSTSVGIRVEIEHMKPSVVGETVVARATLVDVDARRLQFTTTVADANGAAIAVARVWRVVVERDRFLDR